MTSSAQSELVTPAGATTVLVAAAILIEDGRVLLTQRKRGAHLEGAWEFPGGKVEPGEDPRDALARELREEVGIDAAVGDIVEVTFHRYPMKAVLLLFYRATRCTGSPEPRALDVADVRWAAAEALREDEFPPADIVVLSKVRKLLASAAR
ncbi:8-oxo-dGTP diphosphatase MutT [Chondromyces crocatus]|uniref:8-oxo-dGTP diphosphatase n=1 Tax=Chondromyces crocatus TaxID=52 RepID=A0A0K1E7X1_CHOCO|nr:8-oxo-dGTP diphosphatase MutT [Chondromyces crocatus]AKT36658.1 DNA mismatch repair protein MutT [Chondromyces crocatus]